MKRSCACLCGSVKVSLTISGTGVHACHCNICQKWGSAQSMSLACSAKDWEIEGEDMMNWYDSSAWGQRSFCSCCGTHMLFRANDGSYAGVNASLLNDKTGLFLDSHIFIDKKPPNYDFTGEARRMTEE